MLRHAQLLPCGHRMCEACYQTHYNRGMKRLQCVWCRKPFAASGINAAVICPAGKPQHARQDDPKYATVSTVNVSFRTSALLYLLCLTTRQPRDGMLSATPGMPLPFWFATA